MPYEPNRTKHYGVYLIVLGSGYSFYVSVSSNLINVYNNIIGE